MSLEWEQVIVDARNPAELGRWWQEALGWVVVNEDPEAYEIRPAPEQLPGLLFVPVPEGKAREARAGVAFISVAAGHAARAATLL